MAQLQLFGGAQDGLVKKITGGDHPELFYVHAPSDDERISKVRGAAARKELRDKLSVLAYQFDKTVTKTGVGVEYQYRRCPEHDRVAA